MRQCPRCTYPLEILRHKGSELDHCSRCGGSFLEPGEAGAIFGDLAEPSHWQSLPGTQYLEPSKLHCPTGDDMTLEAYRVQFDSQQVEVDVCPGCKGLWLDGGEGKKLYNIALAAQTKPARAVPEPEEPQTPKTPGVGSYIFQVLTAFPIEVWNPVRKPAFVTIGLVIAMALLFIWELGIGANSSEGLGLFINFVGVIPKEIVHGRHLQTLITYAFFHLGLLHIVGNLYFLWVFGDNVEDILGQGRYVVLYILTALGGALLYVAFNSQSTLPMVGASGAISGIMGAYMVLFPKVKVWVVWFFIRFQLGVLWFMGVWIGMQFLSLFSSSQEVAWLAHIGGFIVGVVFANLSKNRLVQEPRPV